MENSTYSTSIFYDLLGRKRLAKVTSDLPMWHVEYRTDQPLLYDGEYLDWEIPDFRELQAKGETFEVPHTTLHEPDEKPISLLNDEIRLKTHDFNEEARSLHWGKLW